ncbi:hypothetical protein [Tropicimonas aquimaris]|uniref:Uncharacterized protein n=1 Tax=Tropicimonas aquimaris TaxID=914152 RepID=A0ABW3IX54_9RHOB
MSTWIFNPALFTAALSGAAMLLSSACTTQTPVSRAAPTAPALRKLPVLDNAVVITAPPGYCIDMSGSRSERRDAFVLLASCRAITGDDGAPAPSTPGLLMASVDGTNTAGMPPQAEIEKFFASSVGRSALSREGDPDAVTLGESRFRDGTYMINVRERGGSEVLGAQSWRAVFSVNGRMVTATLREVAEAPINSNEGFRTVERFARDIRRASPAAP